jgi:hypothetical protein
MKRIKPRDWPSLILRGAAILLIAAHLFTGFFVYSHMLFFVTAVVMALLLTREMYEDLAMRFFEFKSEIYARDLDRMMERETEPREVGSVINAEPLAPGPDAPLAAKPVPRLADDGGDRRGAAGSEIADAGAAPEERAADEPDRDEAIAVERMPDAQESVGSAAAERGPSGSATGEPGPKDCADPDTEDEDKSGQDREREGPPRTGG